MSGVSLLRVYWYDGTATGPSAQHLTLAHLDHVKLRLDFVNTFGQQKGVDSLIVTDMINLARNRAIADAVLLSGDEDLRVGVQQAQEFGVRVHLLGIKPARGSQSLFLMQEADTHHEWGAPELAAFLSVRTRIESPAIETPTNAATPPEPVPLPQTAPIANADSTDAIDPEPRTAASTPIGETSAVGENRPQGDQLDVVAELVAADIPGSELDALIQSIEQSGQVPKQFDGLLLAKGRSRLGVLLEPLQKRALRASFVAACKRRRDAMAGN